MNRAHIMEVRLEKNRLPVVSAAGFQNDCVKSFEDERSCKIIGESVVLGADGPPDQYEEPRGISVTVPAKTLADAERIFSALSEGGKVTMPLQQTFWSPGFAMLVDRFGIPG